MSNFKRGEKVVCINNIYLEEEKIKIGIKCPIKNKFYTIRGFKGNKDAILVNEIINPLCYYGNKNIPEENGFYLHHFKKLDYEFAENLLKEISESVNKKHLQN